MDTLNTSEFVGWKCSFELWTTGEPSAEAKEAIDKTRVELRSTRYQLNVRYGAQLMEMAREAGNATVEKVLRQYFIAHPRSLTESVAIPARTQQVR